MNVCGNCEHWKESRRERWELGVMVIGTCALGGPSPEDGCSDTHREETCLKHKPKEQTL